MRWQMTLRTLTCAGILVWGVGNPDTVSAQSGLETIEAGPVQQSLLAIYGDGIAVVEERRTAVFSGGPALVRLTGLPEGLISDSVTLSIGGVPAGDIRLGRDRIAPDRLLEQSVGNRIAWVSVGENGVERRHEGTLLAHRGGVVMEIDGHVEVMPAGRLVLDNLPSDLIDGTWVEAEVGSSQPGDLPIALGYLAPGISWAVDYDVELGTDESALVLAGRYSLRNDGELPYPNATVRLVAGAVNRAARPPVPAPQPQAEMMMARATMAADAPGAPKRAALGDLHVYDLDQPLELPAAATIRRELFAAVTVPVEKRYLLRGRGDGWPGRGADGAERQRPTVKLHFENHADGPLARPLPAGTVRVFGTLSGDGLDMPRVVLGEDRIAHTAVGEPVRVTLGQAFDVSAERRMTAFELDENTQRGRPVPYEVAHKITLHNAKDKPVTVDVTERFSAQYAILTASVPPEGTNARAAEWKIDVPARGKTVLAYRVKVTP